MTFDLYFAKNQFGLRKQHSTEHAILEGVDRIGSTMDNENIPIAIFLELSKAFDILDHKTYCQNHSIMASKISISNGLRVIAETDLKMFRLMILNLTQLQYPLESLRGPFYDLYFLLSSKMIHRIDLHFLILLNMQIIQVCLIQS